MCVCMYVSHCIDRSKKFIGPHPTSKDLTYVSTYICIVTYVNKAGIEMP